MNEFQYARLCENRRRRGTLRLGETRKDASGTGGPIGSVLRRAARRLRQREAAIRAWERVARGAWLAEASVHSVEPRAGDGYTIVIETRNATLCYELRRRKATLERQMAHLATGARGLRFVVGAENA